MVLLADQKAGIAMPRTSNGIADFKARSRAKFNEEKKQNKAHLKDVKSGKAEKKALRGLFVYMFFFLNR